MQIFDRNDFHVYCSGQVTYRVIRRVWEAADFKSEIFRHRRSDRNERVLVHEDSLQNSQGYDLL